MQLLEKLYGRQHEPSTHDGKAVSSFGKRATQHNVTIVSAPAQNPRGKEAERHANDNIHSRVHTLLWRFLRLMLPSWRWRRCRAFVSLEGRFAVVDSCGPKLPQTQIDFTYLVGYERRCSVTSVCLQEPVRPFHDLEPDLEHALELLLLYKR